MADSATLPFNHVPGLFRVDCKQNFLTGIAPGIDWQRRKGSPMFPIFLTTVHEILGIHNFFFLRPLRMCIRYRPAWVWCKYEMLSRQIIEVAHSWPRYSFSHWLTKLISSTLKPTPNLTRSLLPDNTRASHRVYSSRGVFCTLSTSVSLGRAGSGGCGTVIRASPEDIIDVVPHHTPFYHPLE